MAEPYLSEIRIMAFGHPPQGWARCDGALLSVQQNQALFGLLGTTYGGDGVSTFALPDLRGRIPVHVGSGHVLGEQGGAPAHALTLAELPLHTHGVQATDTAASGDDATDSVLARAGLATYASGSATLPMGAAMVGSTGGSQSHPNMQPFLTMSFCIALQGSLPAPASP